MTSNLPFNLDSVTQNISRLKLTGGLAGKICYVLIYVALAMAVISWSVKTLVVSLLSLAMIFVLSLITLWRLINLADKNPQSALMEGAEFLLHEQLLIGTKQQPEIPLREVKVVESGPIVLSAAEQLALNQPEEEPPHSDEDRKEVLLMATFYHIYITPKPGITREDVQKKMDLAIDWFRYDDKNWVVYTTSDAKKWFSRLEKYVEPGGQVLIIKLDTKDYWGFMTENLWDWFRKAR